ncbi:MAG: glycosyl transferase [Acidocella sp. 20-61-6]|nr:MAG: glycosyl transferase [Acidocella sp. 20-61-6]
MTLLLSTYNGAAFLNAQLESILAQTYQNWVLRWRDDGSSDGSVALLHDFAWRAGAQRCVESPSSGAHLGAAQSFLTLLAECPEADMVAFADQDDVWLPEKLSFAVERIASTGDAPALYCARQFLVDADLQGARLSASHDNPPGFPACLTQNIANGNTLVMNAAAAALVARMGQPEGTMHDWWSYITVSACGGAIIFDERPTVFYRLHKGNLIGRAQRLPARALAALRRGPGIFMTMLRRHAETLAGQAGLLTPQARRELKIIRRALNRGTFARVAALRIVKLRRRTWLENLLFGYWFITDKRGTPIQGQAILPHWAPRKQPVAE